MNRYVDLLPMMDRVPLWGLVALVIGAISLPTTLGYLAGRRSAGEDHKNSQMVSTCVAALMGLLAFTLAFTFSMASTRNDTRRQLIMSEANAIGMTYRRAALLPDPHGPEVRALLREYVDVRLEAVADTSKLPAALVKTTELHAELWRHAEEIVAKDSSSWIGSWYIDPLSEVTELHFRRVGMGLHSRVPVIIWVCLGIITLLSMATVGYQAGQAGKWVLFPKIMLALAFATVIALIADLDRPQTGLVKVSQGALERQRDMMREEPSQQQPPPTTTTEPE